MTRSNATITVGYEHSGRGEDITEQINGEVIFLTLSNGRRIQIETHERSDGFITLRCDDMVIRPEASNSIRIG